MSIVHRQSIRVRGARVHNLRNVDVDIPHDRLVVVTGVSGSGKSSLAFDTVFAEGQRRYLESLSTYTRQFLNQLERPDVDLINGLPPVVSIDQQTGVLGRRSTLATVTEIYDYLRLLYARAGTAHCTGCGRVVTQQSPQAIVDQVLNLEDRRKVMILAPLVRGRKGLHRKVFERIAKEGFVRARVDGEIVDAADPPELAKGKQHEIEAVVDRIVIKEGIRARLQESLDLALKHGEGTCIVSHQADDEWIDRLYSTRFACPDCELSFPELEPRTFSFNSPYGACRECEGLGIVKLAEESSRPQTDGAEICPACKGARLNEFARNVTLANLAIHQLTALTITEASEFISALEKSITPSPSHPVTPSPGHLVTPSEQLAAQKTLPDIAARLRFLQQVGLDYLTLDRPTRTLSGGEFQRSRLAGCLGSGLIGVCYILDEPTIGLHPRDTARLIETLEELRDQGNTLLVVEHDGDVMRRADYLIDLGPGAGREGGRVIAAGTPEEVAGDPGSVTGRYLVEGGGWRVEGSRVKSRESRATVRSLFAGLEEQPRLVLTGAGLHNLKGVTVEVPLGALVCVTGVSGSGKSSLIAQTLAPAVRNAVADDGAGTRQPGPFDELIGVEAINRVVEVDQSPLGRTGRSNPATYSGVWNEVRRVFAKTREARLRGYTARRFSFNAKEGRCPECAGQGARRIEMKFMPDMHVTCSACRGARFNRQTLSIRFRGKNVADVLEMRFDEAIDFFENFAKLRQVLKTFVEVGLGYLCLGQSSLTLSGGEAQRVKLATELGSRSRQPTMFVLDEPTTGLHPADIERLLQVCRRLVDEGHTALIIEHELDVIAAADWVVDLGPEGGAAGGEIVAAGPPTAIAGVETSHTGHALRERFAP